MSASQIAISSFYSGAAGIYRTLRYTAETIVGITSLTRIAKVNQRWTVFVVMREGGSVGIRAVPICSLKVLILLNLS